MSVRTMYTGRFGNHVFQYMCARLFAEDHDLRMMTPWNHQEILEIAPQTTGRIINSPTVGMDDNADVFGKAWADGSYEFCGYYHKWQWYQNRKEDILKFIKPKPVVVNHDDIVMHVRLGDYLFIVHPQWYLDILKQENFKKLYIVMESKTGPREEKYLSYFAKYNPTVVSTDLGGDWNFIRQFDRIIASNSTFAWSAAYLSPAQKVYIFKRWCDRNQYDLSNIPNGIPLDGPMVKSIYCPNDPEM